MAIEDAIVLANALLPPEGEAKGVGWYQLQRRERIAGIVKTNDFIGKLYMSETLFWRTARWSSIPLMRWLVARSKARGKSNAEGGTMAWIHKEKILLELQWRSTVLPVFVSRMKWM